MELPPSERFDRGDVARWAYGWTVESAEESLSIARACGNESAVYEMEAVVAFLRDARVHEDQ